MFPNTVIGSIASPAIFSPIRSHMKLRPLDFTTDGMYFRSVDGSALLYFVTEKDSVEGATAVATLADAVDITAEFYFDGSTVYHYINGVNTGSTANSDATFPNDELLRLTLEFLTGEAVANTCKIKWVRLIQIRD